MPMLRCRADSLSTKSYLNSSLRPDEAQEPQLLSKERPTPALDNSQHAPVSFQVWPSQKYKGGLRPSAASPISVHHVLPIKVNPSCEPPCLAWLYTRNGNSPVFWGERITRHIQFNLIHFSVPENIMSLQKFTIIINWGKNGLAWKAESFRSSSGFCSKI